jgi:hypothetical protein
MESLRLRGPSCPWDSWPATALPAQRALGSSRMRRPIRELLGFAWPTGIVRWGGLPLLMPACIRRYSPVLNCATRAFAPCHS